jgi:RIO kinase 2
MFVCSYDGYRLTYMGYDFLALRVLLNRGHITGVGRMIGMGKESDIYEVGGQKKT